MVTVNVIVVVVPDAPSVASASAMESFGGPSSSVIVPVAVARARVAPLVGLWSVTVNVSSSSCTLSSVSATVMVLEVSPALKVSVPAVWAV